MNWHAHDILLAVMKCFYEHSRQCNKRSLGWGDLLMEHPEGRRHILDLPENRSVIVVVHLSEFRQNANKTKKSQMLASAAFGGRQPYSSNQQTACCPRTHDDCKRLQPLPRCGGIDFQRLWRCLHLCHFL